MKFLITTEYNEAFAGVADLTMPVIAEYAERHGYGLLIERNPQCKDIVRRRYETIAEVCAVGSVDWVVHLDADVLLTNLTVPLAEVVEEAMMNTRHPRIIMSECPYKDAMQCNDGVALFAATYDNSIECTMAANVQATGDIWCGQDYFNHISDVPITLLPQHKLNGMLFKEYGMEWPLGEWREGESFALHLPGMRNDRRVEILKEHIPKIVR